MREYKSSKGGSDARILTVTAFFKFRLKTVKKLCDLKQIEHTEET